MRTSDLLTGLLLGGLLFTAPSETDASKRKVGRDATVRSGPGAFNKKVGTVRSGMSVDELETKGNWLKITIPVEGEIDGTKEGWLTVGVLQGNDSSRPKRGLSGLRGAKPLIHVEKSVVVTATKGAFGSKYAQKRGVKSGAVALLDKVSFDSNDYQRFVRSLDEEADRGEQAIKYLGKLSETGTLDVNLEQSIGRAVAARLVSQGVIKGGGLDKYVNLVAARVGSFSPRDDLHYRVFILRSSAVAAFATPGGFIFITKGLLAQMDDESELAGLLGHEIAHCVRLHGLSSFKRAVVQKRADDAFAMLDEAVVETGGKVETIEDLETLADTYYEKVQKGSSREHEKESDIFGVVFAYAAGYDSDGLARLFQRMHDAKHASYSTQDKDKSHLPLDTRVKFLRGFTSQADMGDGEKKRGRFRSNSP
jgi:hypothetical protein